MWERQKVALTLNNNEVRGEARDLTALDISSSFNVLNVLLRIGDPELLRGGMKQLNF